MNPLNKLTIIFLIAVNVMAVILLLAQIKEVNLLKQTDTKRLVRIEGLKRDLLDCGETVRQSNDLLIGNTVCVELKEINK